MRKIFADYNARTESGHIRLGSLGSQEDLRDQKVQVGDWMWLSDGELVVGAQLALDAKYGIVGVPRWTTLVHLDDDEPKDGPAAWAEFLPLARKSTREPGDEARIFQLLTIIEAFGLVSLPVPLPPGYLALWRAGALQTLGEPELSMVELAEALGAAMGGSNLDSLTPAASALTRIYS